MSKKLTIREFIFRAREIHGNEFDYETSIYRGYNNHISIRCRKHNKVFSQLVSNHLHGSKCPECKTDSIKSILRYTTEEFILKANTTHGDKFDYCKSNYINSYIPVIILCKTCGASFEQLPLDHINGRGCNKCGGTMKLTCSEFITKAMKVHGDKFDYSDFKYINNSTKGNIKCNQCNVTFNQSANSHLRGIGCPNCAGNRKLTTQEFIDMANKIHGNNFDYTKVNYTGANSKVMIKCNKCTNMFEQLAKNHIHNKQGCPYCGLIISKPESDFLTYMLIPNDNMHRQVKIIGKKSCDGYDDKTNTIYEFLGDYYHGNLNIYMSNFKNKLLNKTAQELYDKTFSRLYLFKSLGYNIKYIWEYEWNKFKKGKVKEPKIITL